MKRTVTSNIHVNDKMRLSMRYSIKLMIHKTSQITPYDVITCVV